jgi:hypothetical protein
LPTTAKTSDIQSSKPNRQVHPSPRTSADQLKKQLTECGEGTMVIDLAGATRRQLQH